MRGLLQLFLPFMRLGVVDAPVSVQPETAVVDAPAALQRPPSSKRVRRRGAKRVSERQRGYDALVDDMKSTYGFRVRKWRRSMSGCAWELLYHDGRRQRMLESPYPKSPLSCSIFLHEVGHHAIGLAVVRPRCLEELRAWQWSLATMEARGLEIDDKVRDRMRRSMEYAVAKATRRGIRALPVDLLPYLPAELAAGLTPSR